MERETTYPQARYSRLSSSPTTHYMRELPAVEITEKAPGFSFTAGCSCSFQFFLSPLPPFPLCTSIISHGTFYDRGDHWIPDAFIKLLWIHSWLFSTSFWCQYLTSVPLHPHHQWLPFGHFRILTPFFISQFCPVHPSDSSSQSLRV